ncbi:TetR/AcrR family transcriptional regulator [Altererythrobacter sp. MF3-039]|uniref:TetR/AcrR family transcriptional regulator n=1 Tax=Altererythrobacter sp. MF3-039 TaxID=3252901 RepID=UPI00390C649D
MNNAATESTPELLLDLGESAIRSRGYAGFSYADIAREAGIRKASIHHHFPTKLVFGLAVLDRYADRLARALNDIESRNRTGAMALSQAIELYRSALGGGDRLCLCVALASDRELVGEEIRQVLNRANRMVITWLEQILLKGRRDRSISVGGDPATDAISLLAQLQGAQLVARAAGDPSVFENATTTISARLSRH